MSTKSCPSVYMYTSRVQWNQMCSIPNFTCFATWYQSPRYEIAIFVLMYCEIPTECVIVIQIQRELALDDTE